MPKVSSLALLGSVAVSAAAMPLMGAQAGSITILNPGFNNSSATTQGLDSSYQPTSWGAHLSHGEYTNVTSPPFSGPIFTSGQAGYVTAYTPNTPASLFQELTAPAVANTQYTLTVDVGRYNQPTNYPDSMNLRDFGFAIGYGAPTGNSAHDYDLTGVTFFATFNGNGGSPVDGSGGGAQGGVANGAIKNYTLTGYSPGYIPAGDVLIIDFFASDAASPGSGSTALFSNAVLTQGATLVPEPASVALLVMGLLGLGATTIRRSRAK